MLTLAVETRSPISLWTRALERRWEEGEGLAGARGCEILLLECELDPALWKS